MSTRTNANTQTKTNTNKSKDTNRNTIIDAAPTTIKQDRRKQTQKDAQYPNHMHKYEYTGTSRSTNTHAQTI